MKADENEAQRVWARLRELAGAPRTAAPRTRKAGGTKPFDTGRDPMPAARVLAGVEAALGWRAPLAQTDLVSAWREVAGEQTAAHAEVESITDGVLLIRCDSTAWATQLTVMRAEIARRIAQAHPDAGVTAIRFLGPNAPSWNRGPRSVPGRGPRDTYG